MTTKITMITCIILFEHGTIDLSLTLRDLQLKCIHSDVFDPIKERRNPMNYIEIYALQNEND